MQFLGAYLLTDTGIFLQLCVKHLLSTDFVPGALPGTGDNEYSGLISFRIDSFNFLAV